MAQTITYGEYGITLTDTTGVRVDPTPEQREAARVADRIPAKTLRGYFKCDDATFHSIVNEPAFPRVTGYVTSGVLRQRTDSIFSKSEINAWLDRQHARAATLPKAVK